MAIYSNTYGFILTIKTAADLTDTTDMRLRIKRPDTTVDKLLTDSDIVAPASKGVVRYTVANGDFPVGGRYHFQLFDETTGRRLASSILIVEVKESLTI